MAPSPRPLSATQQRILTLLGEAARPLSAYDLLGQLRGDGINAPPTVYRALERLVRDGLAHRIESLNAFVACCRPHHQDVASFAICEACGVVAELTDADLGSRLSDLSRRSDFHATRVSVEMHGRCAACAHKEHGHAH